jgi:undecaprenyl-diphosphatase
MGTIDRAILLFFNEFSQKVDAFDQTLYYISITNLLKGGVIIAVLWALWFTNENGEAKIRIRKSILGTYLGAFAALFLVRTLANILPLKERPALVTALHFRIPAGVPEESIRTLGTWNSFPSDHAALFIALVLGVFVVSRRLGLWSLGYVILVILLPRIYLGLHYPSDIVAGAMIGAGCVMLANVPVLTDPIKDLLLKWSETHSKLFYGIFFLVTYQTAVLYDDVREFGGFLLRLSGAVVRRVF